MSTRHSTHHFDTEEEATQYREEHGTGGWIFVCSDKAESTIYPFHMTPTDIVKTGMTSSSGGRFIGANGKTLSKEEAA